jgi:pyruvate dehydrogenase E1 component alpha subunit
VLARGTHPNAVMAELYGKLEGCSHGYGGSMHLYDVERGNMGANAVVGGGLPAVAGAALAFKLRGEPRVAVAFFGDGATNIGTFHEALNLAQLWKVPAVFVCENNHYAESTPAHQQLPITDLSKRAVAFGMHSITVEGQDVEAVYRAASRALEHARSGKGPVFLLIETFRLVGHYVGDPQVYRPKGELQELRETQDPLDKARAKLGLTDDEAEAIEHEVQELVDASVEFAQAATDPRPEDALKNVYA